MLNKLNVKGVDHEFRDNDAQSKLDSLSLAQVDGKLYASINGELMGEGVDITSSVERPVVDKKDVNFYDYDGTLLYSYTIEEANALSELPELPNHEGLICTGWNHDIEEVTQCTTRLNVGATYTTNDDSTRIYISLTVPTKLEVPLYFSQSVEQGVMVDWGDGSDIETSPEQGNTRLVHCYATTGDYVIRITKTDGCELQLGWHDEYWNQYGYSTRDVDSNVEFSSGLMGTDVVFSNSITKVELGSSVRLSAAVFRGCSNMKSIVLNDVETLSGGCFNQCTSMIALVLSKDTKSIQGIVCSECDDLALISLPSTVGSIPDNAFYRCKSLKDVVIPSSVKILGNSSFEFCSSLTEVFTSDGLNVISSGSFSNCSSLSNIKLADSVTEIALYAFQSCTALEEIDLPKNLITIGEAAFGYCEKLQSLTIPEYTETIGSRFIAGCSSINEINIHPNNSHFVIIDDVIYDKEITQVLCYLPYKTSTVYTVPDTVTAINQTLIDGNNYLQELWISENISFENYYDVLVNDCPNLKSIFMPYCNNHQYRFNNIHPDVIYTFYVDNNSHIYSLNDENVNLRFTGSLLNLDTLSNVGSVRSINVSDTVMVTSSNSGNFMTYPMCAKTTEYDGAYYLSTENNPYHILLQAKETSIENITVHPDCVVIASNAFYNCYNLQTVILSDSVKSVGENAFQYCNAIVYNDYNNGKYIGSSTNPYHTFYGIHSLEDDSVVTSLHPDTVCLACDDIDISDVDKFPEQVIVMPHFNSEGGVDGGCFRNIEYALGCSSPSSISGNHFDLSNALYIGSFRNANIRCKKLTLSNKIKKIPQYAFYNSNFESVTIPEGVTSIGSEAFYRDENLTEIQLPDSVITIGQGAFSYCSSLSHVTFGKNVREILPDAFRDCKLIENVTLPEGVTSIAGDNGSAFAGCTGIKTIETYGLKTLHWRSIPSPNVKTLIIHTPSVCSYGIWVAGDTHEWYPDSDPLGETSFSDGTGIYVPYNMIEEYSKHPCWQYKNRISNILPIEFLGEYEDKVLLFNKESEISFGRLTENNVEWSIVSSNPEIVDIKDYQEIDGVVSFKIISKEIEGNEIITIRGTIEGNTYEKTLSVKVYESYPPCTYTVEPVENTSYGFILNDEGYYESQNHEHPETYSMCKVSFVANGVSRLILDCINEGVAWGQCGIISRLDDELSFDPYWDGSEKYRFPDYQKTTTTIDYGIIPAGEHFVYIKYVNRSYDASPNNKLQFKVHLLNDAEILAESLRLQVEQQLSTYMLLDSTTQINISCDQDATIDIQSKNETILNVEKISSEDGIHTFTVNSLSSTGDGDISLNVVLGDVTGEIALHIHVVERYPIVYEYSVEPLGTFDSVAVDSDGFYVIPESNNQPQMCKISFTNYVDAELTIEGINDSSFVNSYYGVISNIDAMLSSDFSDNTDVFFTFAGRESGTITPVEYGTIPAGKHFVYVRAKTSNGQFKFKVNLTDTQVLPTLDSITDNILSLQQIGTSNTFEVSRAEGIIVSLTSSNEDILTVVDKSTDEKFVFELTAADIESEVQVNVEVISDTLHITRSVLLGVVNAIPECSYAVQRTAADYGFSLNEEGYYESENLSETYTYALCKVSFTTNGASHLLIDCINASSANTQVGALSSVDTTLPMNSYQNTGAYHIFNSTGITKETIDYGIVPAGKHFIYIKYGLSWDNVSSLNNGLQFKVRFATDAEIVAENVKAQIEQHLPSYLLNNSTTSLTVSCDPNVSLTLKSMNEDILTVEKVSSEEGTNVFNISTLSAESDVNLMVTTSTRGWIAELPTRMIPVVAAYPTVCQYTVEPVEGAPYGFALNDEGYYESQNQGIKNSYSLCKVELECFVDTKLTFDCINYVHPTYDNWDYGAISKLDATLSHDYDTETNRDENTFFSFNGMNSPNVVTVEYGVVPAGKHFIYVKYGRKYGTPGNNDSLQFKINAIDTQQTEQIIDNVKWQINQYHLHNSSKEVTIPKDVAQSISITTSDEDIVTVVDRSTENDFVFEINTLDKTGEAQLNIEVISLGRALTQRSLSMFVEDAYPVPFEYQVEPVVDADYGFTINKEGYYESTNKLSNTYALCKVVLKCYADINLTMDCVNSSYFTNMALLSAIDGELVLSATEDADAFYKLGGQTSSRISTVDYGVVPAGEHSIYVKYLLKNSLSAYDNSLQFKLNASDSQSGIEEIKNQISKYRLTDTTTTVNIPKESILSATISSSNEEIIGVVDKSTEEEFIFELSSFGATGAARIDVEVVTEKHVSTKVAINVTVVETLPEPTYTVTALAGESFDADTELVPDEDGWYEAPAAMYSGGNHYRIDISSIEDYDLQVDYEWIYASGIAPAETASSAYFTIGNSTAQDLEIRWSDVTASKSVENISVETKSIQLDVQSEALVVFRFKLTLTL